jgi:hypothetical protein
MAKGDRYRLRTPKRIYYLVHLNNDDLTEDGHGVTFDDMNHTMSTFEDTPYLTPIATQLMREMSNGNSTCDLFSQSKNNNSDDEEDNI